jgi:NADH:ubiquinone oxidoreductase subunit C
MDHSNELLDLHSKKNFLSEVGVSLASAVHSAYYDKFESTALVYFISHRVGTLEIATFLKLSSIFNVNMATDGLAIDTLKHQQRFTVIYNIQSASLNTGFRIITKLSESQVLTSLQSIYPGFD